MADNCSMAGHQLTILTGLLLGQTFGDHLGTFTAGKKFSGESMKTGLRISRKVLKRR